MYVIEWLRTHHEVKAVSTAGLIYDLMESQSGRKLPVVYVPFDPADRGHFADRAVILDFAMTAGPGRVLDFGPGDGWPALLMAPFVREVVGVDGSARRVRVCQENARRIGVTNASFVHVPPGERLPFDDNEFDGATAASSIEQTPDPRATLVEIHRVLKPGAKLRFYAETLNYYANGRETALSISAPGPTRTSLLIYERHIEDEWAEQCRVWLAMPRQEAEQVFARHEQKPGYAGLTEQVLRDLSPAIQEISAARTEHPSCRTWLRWLREIGFRNARPMLGRAEFWYRLFDHLPLDQRPAEIEAVDRYLRPIVMTVIATPSRDDSRPGEWDEAITAEK